MRQHLRKKHRPNEPAKRGTKTSPSPRRFEPRDWLVPAALFAAAALVFLPGIGGFFVWDDEFAVQRNSFLETFAGLRRIWTDFGRTPGEDHYWPLTYSVLWLEWNLWAGHAAGFHILNFILHALIVVQVWRLAQRIGVPGAAIGAALFALHPVHAEAVAWIISIKDLLAALLSLVCIEMYLNAVERGGWKWLAWGALAAAAAMLCKSSPVTLAGAIAILAWYRSGRIDRRDWLWVGAIGAVTIAIALADAWLVKHRYIANPWPIPVLSERIAQSGWTFWSYITHLAWPFGLGPAYPQFELDAARPLDWLPLVLIVLATIALWLARGRIGRAPLACWLFYAVSLSPVIGIIYFDFLRISPSADRYQYWASIGPLLLAGAGIDRAIRKSPPTTRPAWQCAAVALLIGCALLSWRQASYWADSEKLFKRGIATAPDSAYMKQALGTHYMKYRRNAEAGELFRAVLEREPNNWEAVCNLTVILVGQENERAAAEVCRDAIERGCGDSTVLSSYAYVLAMTRDPAIRNPKKAVEYAQRAVRDPHAVNARYWWHLSLALEADGRIAEALDAAVKARRLAGEQNNVELEQQLTRSISSYEKTLRR